MMDTKNNIKAFVIQRIGNEIEIRDEDDIFKLGLVNSMYALELVNYLERTYSITITNDDLDLTNFSSVNNIAEFVERKQQ